MTDCDIQLCNLFFFINLFNYSTACIGLVRLGQSSPYVLSVIRVKQGGHTIFGKCSICWQYITVLLVCWVILVTLAAKNNLDVLP